jgi:gluconate:H+ symporter, GntP family
LIDYYPLYILALGIVTVLGLIIVARMNAFLALIIAALAVSLLSPGDLGARVERVAGAFGSSTAGIGIVIALASIIGKCMLDSGAADRIVRSFTSLLGEKRAPIALLASGFVLAVPVFFDTVFYLLVPLARSLYKRTNRNYLKYLIAIGAGGAITHTLVPPTPGPLLIAANLGIDPGMMIMIGILVAILPAVAGLAFGAWIDGRMPLEMREVAGESKDPPLRDDQLPPLWVAVLPVLLPVLLISANTLLKVYADAEPTTAFHAASVRSWPELRAAVADQAAADPSSPGGRVLEMLSQEQRSLWTATGELSASDEAELRAQLNTVLRKRDFYQESAFFGVPLTDTARKLSKQNISRLQLADLMRVNRALLESVYPELIEPHEWMTPRRQMAEWGALLGNVNLVLLVSALIAILTLGLARHLSLVQVAHAVEVALMSGGVIILITAAGGAFGLMLTEAKVGDSIGDIAKQFGGKGLPLIFLAFAVAAVFKVAQGSSTVSMITTSGMLAPLATVDNLDFHPVYMATAIGAGSLVGSWMNDSGFWVFAKMGGLTEGEALKSWTILLCIMAFTALAVSVTLAIVMPMRGV